MTTPPDDTRSLESWLREKALKAHTKWWTCQQNCHNIECDDDDGVCVATSCNQRGKEEMANEVITKIQNGRVDQRPHVMITEEFDVR